MEMDYLYIEDRKIYLVAENLHGLACNDLLFI